MALDLTAPGRHNRDVHYRHYLADNGRITVVCLQDFDYHDYDPSRFVDEETYKTEAEAKRAHINIGPLLLVIELSADREAVQQAHRNLRAVIAQSESVIP